MSLAALRVRPARSEDLAALTALEAECFHGPWSGPMIAEELSRERAWVDLAELPAGEIAGYSCAWSVLDTCHLLRIATRPADQRHGVGRTLLTHLIGRARSAGHREIELEVASRNHAAIGLYRALGFVQVGKRPAYYSDPVDDAALMLLILDDEACRA